MTNEHEKELFLLEKKYNNQMHSLNIKHEKEIDEYQDKYRSLLEKLYNSEKPIEE